MGDLRGLELGNLQPGTGEDAPENPHPSLRAKEEEDPFQQCLRSEMRATLASSVEGLEEKERQMLGLYYLEELTMKEVGVILNVGESRVSQIHTGAILKLRTRLKRRLRGDGAEGTVGTSVGRRLPVKCTDC